MARTDQPTPKKIKNEVEYRYILEPYRSPSSRTTCPNCNSKHSFTRYIDVTDGTYLEGDFGRCDRVEKCGCFNSPYGKDLGDKPIMVKTKDVLQEFQNLSSNLISTIDAKHVMDSMTFSDKLSQFLLKTFDPVKVMEALVKYKVGESNKWRGATTFWQIDQNLDVRTGKIILYDHQGKRKKDPFPFMTWEHAPLKTLEDKSYIDFNLKQCFFGEHLLKDCGENVNIVEAEKTAIICSIFDPKSTWVATGGIELINEERLLPFRDKKLTFYPDKGEKAMIKWGDKIKNFEGVYDVRLNSSINKLPLNEGEDYADYLINKFGNKNE